MAGRLLRCVFAILTLVGASSAQPLTLYPINQTGPERSSSPQWFLHLSRGTVFVASRLDVGRELFLYQPGQPPQLVKDINPGLDSSNPGWVRQVGDQIFFLADDGVHGQEIWRSDGTEAGTFLVKDLRAGPTGCSGRYLHAMGSSLLFFNATDGTQGGVWRTDGTEAGTMFLSNVGIRFYAATVGGGTLIVGAFGSTVSIS